MGNAGSGQFLEEEKFRGGKSEGSIVKGDSPTFTQPKNGVPATMGEGEHLTFETSVESKEIRRGNRDSVSDVV